MKRIAVLLGFFSLFAITTPRVYARQESVVIINQVRGSECCDVGSMSMLARQIETLVSLQLPAAFALRYDALKDSQIVGLFPQKGIEVGAFLEVTPSLAHDAGVIYKGPVERWYKSENAYLLGYDPRSRIKIIDTYMRLFYQKFGFYPETTVAWMIDAPSLSYLSSKYGVKFHELTREQWGTDSYTLYGGPVGYPYIPSRQWPIVPAFEKENSLPLLVGRQTIVDPVRSYGDGQSVFTSQPNDYMKAGLGVSYFQKLVTQSLAQRPEGFALIGLETSMGEGAQQEYMRQLHYVKELRSKEREVNIVLPSDYAKQRLRDDTMHAINMYEGIDGEDRVVWVTTSRYRLRLIARGQKRGVTIDDFRVYDDHFIDPYTDTVPVTPNAYWIVPFSIDGSRYFQKVSMPIWKRWITPGNAMLHRFDPCTETPTIASDLCSLPDGIKLPATTSVDSISADDGVVRYQTEQGYVTLTFFTDKIHIGSENVVFSPASSLIRTMNTSNQYGMGYVWENGGVTIVPWVRQGAELSQISATYPEAYVPETAGGSVSLSHSLAIPAVTTVQLGRNPIRIVLYMRDDQNRVATSGAAPLLSLREDPEAKIQIRHPETSLAEYYLDAAPTHLGTVTPIITLGTQVRVISQVTVVPNCLRTFACFMHPQMLFSWLKMNIKERLRLR